MNGLSPILKREPHQIRAMCVLLTTVSLGLVPRLGRNRCPQSVYRMIDKTLTSGNGNEDGEEMALKAEKQILPLQTHYVLNE